MKTHAVQVEQNTATDLISPLLESIRQECEITTNQKIVFRVVSELQAIQHMLRISKEIAKRNQHR